MPIMKKILLSFFIAATLLGQSYELVSADTRSCGDVDLGASATGINNLSFVWETVNSIEVDVNTGSIPAGKYQIFVYDTATDSSFNPIGQSDPFDVTDTTKTVTDLTIIPLPGLADTVPDAFTYNMVNALASGEDDKHVYLYKGDWLTGNRTASPFCKLGTYTIKKPTLTCSQPVEVSQQREVGGVTKTCYSYQETGCIEQDKPMEVKVKGIKNALGRPWTGGVEVTGGGFNQILSLDTAGNGSITTTYSSSSLLNGIGVQNLKLKGTLDPILASALYVDLEGACTDTSFVVKGRCNDECIETPQGNNSGTGTASAYKLCDQIPDPGLQTQCRDCAGGDGEGQEGVWTAVGCINRDPMDITKRLIQVGLGMGGGVALIMTLAGGFILSTSQGDPQKANQAKEMITNAVIGLLFVIFSVVILQFIGVRILNIPGFGEGTVNP